MRFRTLMVLLLAGVWGAGSWWWYTCKIKGFCSAADSHAAEMTSESAQPAASTDARPAATAQAASSGDTTDSDQDGLSNAVEKKLGLDPYMADTDKDGIIDRLEVGDNPEAPLDSDDDGTINALDNDDDGDGDLTSLEMPDPNKDGDPADARDSDGDGIPDYLDKDSGWATMDDDNDGVSNGEEKAVGTNPALRDTDGDGVPDGIELVDHQDTDKDGTLDALDTDDDDDGIMTAMENPDPNGDGNIADANDTDQDGLPDYLDNNASGESISTAELPDTQDNPDTDMAIGNSPKKSAEVPESTENAENAETPEPAEATDTPADDKAVATEETATPAATAEETPPASEEPAADDKAAEDNAGAEAAVADNNADNGGETAAAQPAETDGQASAADEDKLTVDTGDSTPDGKGIRPARLYFPFRSAEPELSDSAAAYFDEVIAYLKANPKARITLTGHTDSVGRQAANQKLGQERAEEIRNLMIKRGAPGDQVEVDSKGEEEPLASNKTDAGRKQNRRVELTPVP